MKWQEWKDDVQELDFGLQKAAIVEGNHPEGLEDGPAVGFGASYAFDEQNQTVQFVMSLFGLDHFHGDAGAAQDAGVSGPFSDQEIQLLHGGALGLDIRHAEWLSHAE